MLILCEWVELKVRGIKKNALGKKKGGMKGLLCRLFPFHSSSVAIEKKKKKGVVNWIALPFKSVIQII